MTLARSNLAPSSWSRILLDGARPEAVAAAVAAGRVMPWAHLLLESCRGVETVLDIGSGRGDLSAMLALHGKRTTLLDWSEENLRFSRELFKVLAVRGRFCQADATKHLPFRTSSYDLVFTCGVLEFFSDPQIELVLEESWRVCTRKLIVLVPNALSVAYRLGKWYMERTGAWDWNGEVPFRSLRSYFKKLGAVRITEYSIASNHALKFLTMPVGKQLAGLLQRALPSAPDSRPAFLRQGYLLVTVAEKA